MDPSCIVHVLQAPLEASRHSSGIDSVDVAWLKVNKEKGNACTCMLEALCVHCHSQGHYHLRMVAERHECGTA
eukprot:13105696-Alexandrium_andersonii.AAC.1